MPSEFNISRTRLLWLVAMLLLQSGCASDSSKPLLNSFVSYVPIKIQLMSRDSQQPLADVTVSRLDPVASPDSTWNRIWHGGKKAIATKIGTTDKEGKLSISGEYRNSEFEFQWGRETFAFHCGEKHELRLIRGERVVPFDDMMRKNEEGVLQIFVTQMIK